MGRDGDHWLQVLHLWCDEVDKPVSGMGNVLRSFVRPVLIGTIASVLIAATIAVEVCYPGVCLAAYEALLCVGFGSVLGVALFYTFVLPLLERHFG